MPITGDSFSQYSDDVCSTPWLLEPSVHWLQHDGVRFVQVSRSCEDFFVIVDGDHMADGPSRWNEIIECHHPGAAGPDERPRRDLLIFTSEEIPTERLPNDRPVLVDVQCMTQADVMTGMEVAEVFHARLRCPQEGAASGCRAGAHDPTALVDCMGIAETRPPKGRVTEDAEFLPDPNVGPDSGLFLHIASDDPPIIDVNRTAVHPSEIRRPRARGPYNRSNFRIGQHGSSRYLSTIVETTGEKGSKVVDRS